MPDLDLKRLAGRRLFVGTPMYDGKCHSEYAFAIAQLTALCTRLDIALRFYFACNDALITKARNTTVDEFLRSDNDTLVFIDADIGFDALDVIRMLALQSLDPRAAAFDVVAAPYPLKRLSWDRVLRAARSGMADEDPELLARCSSAVAISLANGPAFALDEPVEVTQAGTGFMMIRRDTFARYAAHHATRRYRPEPIGNETGPLADIYAFFDTEIDGKHGNMAREIRAFLARTPDATGAEMIAFLDDAGDAAAAPPAGYSDHYISEDYAFCRRVREAGMKVWLCPWMELTHTGAHRFTSRLVDLAAIGAA